MHPFYMLYVIEKQALKKMIYGKWIWIHWPNSFLHPVQYPPLKLSLFLHLQLIWGESPLGLLRWLRGKESAFQCRRCKRHELDPWVRKIPWRRKWQPTPVFFPGKPHRGAWWATVPGGCKDSNTAEWLSTPKPLKTFQNFPWWHLWQTQSSVHDS